MNKVLILSCNTGQGHNSCAQAIKEYFIDQGVECEIADTLAFISKSFSSVINHGHNFIYRYLPGVFRWGYQFSEEHNAVFNEKSLVNRVLTSGIDKMYDYIKEGEYDSVITTHCLSAMILTCMQKKYEIELQTSFVATDYTCSPSMDASDVQYYFIPDSTLAEEFIRYGIPEEKLVATGIPVRKHFLIRYKKEAAKRVLRLKADYQHVLVMCGSMGCNSIEKVVEVLVKKKLPNTEISVICGTNKRLQRKMRRKFRKCKDIHIVGYTNKIPLYMDASDVYITKPGGISVTEAAVKGVPMGLLNAVAGCETYNMNYFVEKGAAFTSDSMEELAEKGVELLSMPEERYRMEQALIEYDPDASKRIFETLNQ